MITKATCGFGCDSLPGNALKRSSCSAKVRMLMIPIPRDFRDFLRLLSANGIKYVVIGGYAVAFHGYVRYTGDLDIFVELSVQNAEKLADSTRIWVRLASRPTRVIPAKGENHSHGLRAYALGDTE